MAIQLQQVSYTYAQRSLWRQTALHGIDLDLPQGSIVGIAGSTGSGKSTLLQLFNGILRPTQGKVSVLDITLHAGEKTPKLLPLRRRVGLVFQFPEQQMFAETVEKDLCFGPLNFGMSPDEARERARRAMLDMGLDLALLERNPFRLSGGQMRKAAIASVLAADPEIIVLDEPTASLDPASRKELIGLLTSLCRERGRTVIVVTHRMDELLPYADLWVILNQGRAVFQGGVKELAADPSLLTRCGLAVPDSLRYWRAVADRLGLENEAPRLTAEGLAELIVSRSGKSAACAGQEGAGHE
ncbi:energy-coupling factor transport system ATP-binding protein [Paenibacillus sophorae]|uniref:ATP-binding cassette domain-containing protein n=1 Tax=Paenibacillus sophorae TaxID=1333845 RepID=A0A1H8VE38_9BACL|nr:ATP-binding cassette domain-containing protein [Paenibacillus sophorae]QWU16661.1 ATP-binding cassette domain-containing protein [Paenibacillus sophorae]SEP13675.1 energy-coupling factor transport system ATP-binding protein [Paenibacillus sophorae]